MSVDILGTNCDQCRSTVQCCFTSTETVRFIRTDSPGRQPRLWHSSWTLDGSESVSAHLYEWVGVHMWVGWCTHGRASSRNIFNIVISAHLLQPPPSPPQPLLLGALRTSTKTCNFESSRSRSLQELKSARNSVLWKTCLIGIFSHITDVSADSHQKPARLELKISPRKCTRLQLSKLQKVFLDQTEVHIRFVWRSLQVFYGRQHDIGTVTWLSVSVK